MSSYTTTPLFPEEEYRSMVLDKTGGLFRLAVRLMQEFSTKRGADFSPLPLVNLLGEYFQIRDDYLNIARYTRVRVNEG